MLSGMDGRFSVGGRTRTRTLDPLIKSQLLYQLSYAPVGRRETAATEEPLFTVRGVFVQPL